MGDTHPDTVKGIQPLMSVDFKISLDEIFVWSYEG
jgi:hypothetical protein